MADSIKDSLLKAIQTVVDNSVSNIVADVTITATIKRLDSAASNRYLITYAGGEAYAYSENGLGYSANDLVYVLVPEGNYTNKKIILSKAKSNTDEVTSDDLSAIANNYNIIGTNLFKFRNNYSIGLHSHYAKDEYFVWTSDEYFANIGKPSEIKDDSRYCNYNIIDIQNLENLIKDASAIMLKTNIKTSLDAVHSKSTTGHYGLSIGIVYSDVNNKDAERYEQLNFTTRDMMGNPLNFFYGLDQYKIYDIDTKNFKRIDYIAAYSGGFTDNFEQSDADIFFRNLELNVLMPITSRNGDYTLCMQAPQGFTIKSYEEGGWQPTDELEIFGKTTYLNSDISDRCTYYWAAEDLTVTRYDSNNYNIYTGTGWKILGSSNSKRFVTTGLRNPADENVYKCVSVYDSDGTLIVLEEQFKIYNENNKLECKIDSNIGTSFQFGIGTPTLTCHVEDDSNINEYRFIWRKEDLTGSCVLNQSLESIEREKQDALKEASVSGKDSLNRTPTAILTYYSQLKEENQYVTHKNGNVYSNEITYDAKGLSSLSSTTFKCVVQRRLDSWVNAGSATITLTNEDVITNPQYRIVIDNGSQVFQYNEIGISPASESNQDPIIVRQLYGHFFDPSGEEITDYCSFRWIIPTESTMILPNISMTLLNNDITNEKYVKGKECVFNIAENYNLNSLNNQIVCCVSYQGQEFRQPTNFLFTKIGEVGTNGTQTTVKITENKEDGHDNVHLAYIKEYTGKDEENNEIWDWSWNYLKKDELAPFKAELYTHNEKIFGYSPTWTPAGMNSASSKYLTINKQTGSVEMVGNDKRDDVRVATAKINFNNKTYYGSYPIYTIEYEKGFSKEDYPIDIKNPETLQYITYDSNGTNPQFNTAQGGVFIDRKWDNPDHYYVNWEVKGGVETDTDTNPAIKLTSISGSTIGSQSIKRELTLLNEAIDSISEIENTLEQIVDTNAYDIAKAAYSAVRYHLVNNLIDNMEQRIANAKAILENLIGESENWDINDRISVNIIFAKFEEIFSRIIGDINDCKQYNINSQRIYDNILNYLNSVENVPIIETIVNEGKETTQEISHKNYVNKIWEFWEKIDKDLRAILNPLAEDYQRYRRILDYTSEPNERYKNDIEFGEDIPVSQIHDNNWEVFLNFASQFDSFVFSTKEVSSNLGSTLIAYLSNQEEPQILNEIYIVPAQTYSGITCNHRVIASIYEISSGEDIKIATVTIPIHLSLNTYELASLNGWDGTHIAIDEEENYILAPQIGAGIKNPATNSFTGLVMGSISNNTENGYSTDKVGLMGYSEGRQSVFIDAKTGSAEFGLAAEGSADDRPYSEGRIKLMPGGVSEISKWKIGRDSLYNVVEGDMGERYADLNSDYPKSIPHNKSGVMLSADPAYLSIKGRPLTNKDGINFNAANAVVKEGDTLELQLDAQQPSIFTIYRHTEYDDKNKEKTGEWRREPKVGIDSNGRFYTNALKDNTTALTIGSIGAFGKTALDDEYVGASFEIGTGSTTNELLKVFTDAKDVNSEIGTLYLSGATSTISEYQRPLHLYGKEIKLYSSNGSSSDTSPDYISVAYNNIVLNTGNTVCRNSVAIGTNSDDKAPLNGMFFNTDGVYNVTSKESLKISRIVSEELPDSDEIVTKEASLSFNSPGSFNLYGDNSSNIELSGEQSAVNLNIEAGKGGYNNGIITLKADSNSDISSDMQDPNRAMLQLSGFDGTNPAQFTLTNGGSLIKAENATGVDSNSVNQLNLSSGIIKTTVADKFKISKANGNGGNLEVEGSNSIVQSKNYDSKVDSNGQYSNNYRIPIISTDSYGNITLSHGYTAATSGHTHTVDVTLSFNKGADDILPSIGFSFNGHSYAKISDANLDLAITDWIGSNFIKGPITVSDKQNVEYTNVYIFSDRMSDAPAFSFSGTYSFEETKTGIPTSTPK